MKFKQWLDLEETTGKPNSNEWFTWGPHRYNVTAAMQYIRQNRRKLERQDFPIEALAQLLPFIRLDRNYAASRHVAKSGIVVVDPDLGGHAMLIDGWHRVRKLLDSDEKTMKAWVIEDPEIVASLKNAA